MLHRTSLAILCAATIGGVMGCSGEAPQSGPSDESTAIATDAISRVEGCSSDMSTCESDAGDPGGRCRASMCSCLGKVGPGDDAGRKMRPEGDGAADVDGRAAVDACLSDLKTCVRGSTDPRTCADEAIKCLKAADRRGGPDDRDGAAPARGMPPVGRPMFDGGKPSFPGRPSFDAGPPPHFPDFGDAGFPHRP